MPGYDDVASLYYEDSRWVVQYARRPDPAENHSVCEGEARPYSKETILTILDAMVSDHA